MPSPIVVIAVYKIIKFFNWLSHKLESGLWGYKFCKKCEGRGLYPSSGMWDQPDGYGICPRCRGFRWDHCFVGMEGVELKPRTIKQSIDEIPIIKPETYDIVMKDYSKNKDGEKQYNYDTSNKIVKKILEENPIILFMALMNEASQKNPEIRSLLALNIGFVYQLLETQIEINNLNREFK